MKPLLLALLFLINTYGYADTEFFDENFNDFQENLEEAKEANKTGVFVFFHLEDCPFCDQMRKTVLNQPEVINRYAKDFLSFEVDANGMLEMTDFQGNNTTQREFSSKKNNVFATPVLAFFDLEGNRIAYKTGFASKQDFLLLADYVAGKQYQNQSFMRYKFAQKYNK